MKASDNERVALRVGAAGAALHDAIVECFRVLTADRPDGADPDGAPLTAARAALASRAAAYARVLRDTGIRESEIAPAIHRAVMFSAPPGVGDGHDATTSRVLQWTADALAR